MTTMLQLVQKATGEMGLTVPTVVAGSTSQDTIQQLALLNAVGNEVARQHPWQALTKANIVTTSSVTLTGDTVNGSAAIVNITTAGLDTTYQVTGAGINQATYVASVVNATTLSLTQRATATATGVTFTFGVVKYAMPSDYDRQIDRTHWDKSRHWEMLGPESPQQWEWLISGFIATGPRIRYRILGGYFQIWPMVTTANEQLGFEYVSNGWASTAAGVAKSSFTVDTDTCIFSDRLMVLGLKKKYFEVKGFGPIYDSDYNMELNIEKANDAGSATLAMTPQPANLLIGWHNIPDTGYGT